MLKTRPRREAKAIRLPSGDHDGVVSGELFCVTRKGSLPSAFMTQMSKLPARLETKAMRLPSGDQQGKDSDAVGVSVRMRRPAPSALMTRTSEGPPRLPMKATLLPSGDHAGIASPPTSSFGVSRTGLDEPSTVRR